MRKRLFLLALLMSVALSGSAFAGQNSSQSVAPDRVGKWDMGLGIAGAMNDTASDAAYFSTSVSYGVTPYIGLGVEAGWQESDGNELNEEALGAVPILFDIIVRVPTVHESIVPYGVLGLGAIGVYATNEDGTGSRQGDDVDDIGFGWKLGGGLDWFLNDRWIFNFEFAYLNADVELPTSSLSSGDYDFWTIGVALKYVF